MTPPLRVFIGFDSKEPAAYHTLSHSILTRATGPVMIAPLVQDALRSEGIYTRERGPTEATEFSMTRFLVPYLSRYSGHSVFMDCDMLCRVDITELWDEIAAQCFWHHEHTWPGNSPTAGYDRRDKAVLVCKHDYTPQEGTKMQGQVQTVYPRKNWSSFMVFDNARCRALTPEYVNTASGLQLHRFQWIPDLEIGSLPLEWNYLVGAPNQSAEPPKVVHYTEGGPWWPEYAGVEYAEEWLAERDAALGIGVAA